jgi:glycosyltransferase involved in cell wall biosynthesis
MRVINEAHLFDSTWYISKNRDVALAAIDGLAHYVAHGASEGRDPHPLFGTDWYLARNPDVATSQVNPLAHYIAYGAWEGRDPHPLFDTDWYLSRNPDLAQSGMNPLAHYVSQGASERRDPHPLFDTDWYLSQNPDVVMAQFNPLVHYLMHGAWEGRDPHPLFDNDWYLSENPDVAAGHVNPLVHYVEYGALEGREPNPFFHVASPEMLISDAVTAGMNPLVRYTRDNPWFRQRRDAAFRAAVEAFGGLAAIEPELLMSISPSGVSNLKYVTGLARGPRPAAWRKLFRSLAQAYDRMIFARSVGLLGTNRIALNALKAAQERYGQDSTLLVLEEGPDASNCHRLSPGSHVRVLSDLHPGLTGTDREEITSYLIYHLQPRAVLNVNSASLWQAIEGRGAALSRVTKLHAHVYGRTFLSDGRIGGLTDRYFRICFPHLTRIYLDSASLREMLVRNYGVPANLQERLLVVPQPAHIFHTPVKAALSKPRAGRDSNVFWVGPLSAESNPTLVIEIARRCPARTFYLYGGGESAFVDTLKKAAAPDVCFKENDGASDAMPVERHACFVNTSVHEDLSSLLIEVASRNIPIVTCDVDGIGELVDDETGWVIKNYREPQDYIEALDEIARNPDEVARRLANMSARIRHRHSWDCYIRSFSQSPSFLG